MRTTHYRDAGCEYTDRTYLARPAVPRAGKVIDLLLHNRPPHASVLALLLPNQIRSADRKGLGICPDT